MSWCSRQSMRSGVDGIWVAVVVYALLCVARLGFIFSPGCVHPDEHFQAAAPAAAGLLGWPATLPWEYTDSRPARSFLHPAAAVAGPFLVFDWVFPETWQVTWALLIGSRLPTFLASFVIDQTIWKLTGSVVALCYVASAWPTLIFGTRPFSNSAEAVTVAVVWQLTSRNAARAADLGRRWMLLGCICVIGVFLRFTFLFYALPLLVARAVDDLKAHSSRRLMRALSQGAIMASVVAILVAVLDNVAYGNCVFGHDIWTDSMRAPKYLLQCAKFIVTPWNSLVYNSNIANLSNHGLHPRYTHILVNMPLMFGFMAIQFWRAAIFSAKKAFSDAFFARSIQGEDPKSVPRLLFCIAIPLVCLSVAPHQEPRFLLPLLIPLVLLISTFSTKPSAANVVAFAAFNVFLSFFFGVAHQGGLVSSIDTVSNSLKLEKPNVVVFFGCYSIPDYLLNTGNLRRKGKHFHVHQATLQQFLESTNQLGDYTLNLAIEDSDDIKVFAQNMIQLINKSSFVANDAAIFMVLPRLLRQRFLDRVAALTGTELLPDQLEAFRALRNTYNPWQYFRLEILELDIGHSQSETNGFSKV